MYLSTSHSKLDDNLFLLSLTDLDAKTSSHLEYRYLLDLSFRLTCPRLLIYCLRWTLRSLILHLAGI